MPVQPAAYVWRNFNVDGVSASGLHKPDQVDIRAWGTMIEGTANSSTIVKKTLTQLQAVTPAAETNGGMVLDDPDPDNNGIYYRDNGAWVWGRGLPDTSAKVTLSGTGTAQTGTLKPGVVPANVEMFYAKVATPNTGAMTLSIGGEAARQVVNVAGNPLSAGEWTGVVMFFLNDDGKYQLMLDAGAAAAAAQSASDASDQADRAEDAEDGAVAAKTAAQAAASSVSPTEYPTIATAQALTPASAPDFIRTAGYSASGDGGGALYKKVDSEPSHAGKFSITLSDGTTVVYEIAESVIYPEMLGAKGDGDAEDTTALRAALSMDRKVELLNGRTFLTDTLFPPSEAHLVINKGAVLKSISHDTTHNPVICLGDEDAGVSGVIIEGGGKIDGNKSAQTGTSDEWSHGILVWGSSGNTIRGVEVANCQGDGICIGYDTGRVEGSNGNTVEQCEVYDQKSNRQAIAITYGNENKILFNRCSGNIDLEINSGTGECKNNLVMGNTGRATSESLETPRISDLQILLASLDTDADHYFGNRVIGNTCCYVGSGYGRKTSITGNTIVGSNSTQNRLVGLDASDDLVFTGNTLTANMAVASALTDILRTRACKNLVVTDNIVDNETVPFHSYLASFASVTAAKHYFRGNQVLGTGNYRLTTPLEPSEWGLFRIDVDSGTVSFTQLSGVRLAGGVVSRSADNIIISSFGGGGTATRIKFLNEGSVSASNATTLDAAILAKIVASGSNRTCTLLSHGISAGAVTLSAFAASTGTGTFFFEAWW